MKKNDYVCSEEPLDKQVSDYKKSTTLWSSIANKKDKINKWLLVFLIVSNILWSILSSYLAWLSNKEDIVIKVTCQKQLLPNTWADANQISK